MDGSKRFFYVIAWPGRPLDQVHRFWGEKWLVQKMEKVGKRFGESIYSTLIGRSALRSQFEYRLTIGIHVARLRAIRVCPLRSTQTVSPVSLSKHHHWPLLSAHSIHRGNHSALSYAKNKGVGGPWCFVEHEMIGLSGQGSFGGDISYTNWTPSISDPGNLCSRLAIIEQVTKSTL